MPSHQRCTVTIAADVEQTGDERAKQAFFIVEPNQKQLIEIAAMLDAGGLQPVVNAIVPFEQAAAAYKGQIAQSQGRGKTVVAVTEQARQN